jgi:hypothetical protein
VHHVAPAPWGCTQRDRQRLLPACRDSVQQSAGRRHGRAFSSLTGRAGGLPKFQLSESMHQE